MWANSVWGLGSLAAACFLAWLTVPEPILQFWLLTGAIVFGAFSGIVLVCPFLKSRARVEPIYVIVLGLLIALGGAGWQWRQSSGRDGNLTPNEKPSGVSEIKMTIKSITFPGDDTAQFWLNIHLENRGGASTVKDGVLSVFKENKLYLKYEPREFITGPILGPSLQYQRGPYLAREPLNSGAQIDTEIRYSVRGNAKEELSGKNIRFVLVAEDVYGKSIVSNYVMP